MPSDNLCNPCITRERSAQGVLREVSSSTVALWAHMALRGSETGNFLDLECLKENDSVGLSVGGGSNKGVFVFVTEL